MKRNILSSLILLALTFTVSAQNSYRGVLKDVRTDSPLSNADILIKGLRMTSSDSLGYFRFKYNSDKELLEIRVYRHDYQTAKFNIRPETKNILLLSPLELLLENLTVTAYREKRGNNAFSYSSGEIKKINTLTGEPDVMRIMQVLPGISQGMEGGMGFYVRGAGNSNNRVELNNVPIIAPTHLFGLFSSFHTDIIDKSTFQMGGITASSGDLLASLLKIETHTPAFEKYSGSASLSPLMVGASLQGYIVKDKLSFQIAARSSLLRAEYLLAKKLSKGEIVGDFNPQVQDLYAKLHWKIDDKNSLNIMSYGSHDYFSYTTEPHENGDTGEIAFAWDNRVAKLGWRHELKKNWHIESSAYYSGFENKRRQKVIDKEHKQMKNGALFSGKKNEWALLHRHYYEKERLSINAGIDFRNRNFAPFIQNMVVAKDSAIKTESRYHSTLSTFFAEAQYLESDKYKLKAGVRYNIYENEKNFFHDLEIRLLSSIFLTKNLGLEASYDQLSQFQHTLEGLPLGWSLDIIVPASKQFKPEKAHQWYGGGFYGNKNYYFTLGGYYKTLSNIVSYKSLLNHFSPQNISWEEDAVSGNGKSYGMEVWLEKRNSRWNGSIAYTLSKTTRQFDEINNGRTFSFKFDRTHNLNLQSQLVLLKRAKHEQHFNLALYLSSGNNMTRPVATYQSEDLPYWDIKLTGIYIPPLEEHHATVRTQMSSVNGYRLPTYFRIDAGYSFLWKGKKIQNELTLSVFNLLNRQNPYLIFQEDNQWKQLSILPIIPSIRWEIKF